MRLDKFLKVSRIIKRRTTAKNACMLYKVFINGKLSKPSSKVKVGDILEISFGDSNFKVEIKEIKEHIRNEEADNMYKIIWLNSNTLH